MRFRHPLACLAALLWLVPAMAADRMMIVLDASGSMWAQVGGVSRVEIARKALADVLAGVPAEREIGLIAYGHRRKGDCADIEALVAPAPGSAAEITRIAGSLNALGKTPLTAAVRSAAEAMRYTEDRATVVLLTDGLETCNADPCALGAELEAAGVDLTVHIVGFGLSDAEGRQVACLAEATGGRYIPAADAASLTEALTQTVAAEPPPQPEKAAKPAPEPAAPPFNLAPTAALSAGDAELSDPAIFWEVLGPAGDTVAYGYGTGWTASLPPGDYRLRTRLGEVTVESPLTLAADATATPHVVLDAAVLTLRARPNSAADPVDPGASINVAWDGGDVTGYGEGRFVVPAGELRLTARIGTGELRETLNLAPSSVTERDLVLAIGRVAANAFYTAGGEKVTAPGLAIEVASARKRLDGGRESFGTLYGPDQGFDLVPGDYVLVARLDAVMVEVPFTVRAGELTEVAAILDAGVLAASAPGAYSIEIVAARPDLQGSRVSFGLTYGESAQLTLPGGDYLVLARMTAEGPTKEAAATVRPGERTEATLP